MRALLASIRRPFDWLFRIANGHGDHLSARDAVDAQQRGAMRDANAEAKIGPPPTGGSGGLF